MPAENPGARVQELFLAASRVPAEDREQWLHDRCGGDEHLLAEVRSLLRYEDLPHDPLESGPFSVDSLPPALQHKQTPPAVPGYRIVREIGTGGQAIVYEAVQESTTQRVALKVLRWGAMASAQERERLRREVHILARLKHPGIVSIIDCGETEAGVFFIATQFVDGHSVDAFTASKHVDGEGLSTTESLDESLRLFVKICTAVDAAHRAGVVHRDLKPANILVDGEGEPRVLDFGLAKPGLHESLDTDNLELTRSGQFMGSLPWASPEQAEGTVVDARSDVYSLGVILYQLVSGGQFPYDVSGSMREVITKIMHADPTPLTEAKQTISRSPQGVLPAVPLVEEELNAIVLQALAKCPADRYQSAAELAAAINHFCLTRDGGLPRHEVATVAGQRQRGTLSRWLAMLVSLAAVVMVVGYASKGWFANQQQSQAWRDLEFENVGADGEAATELAFPTVSAAALAIRGTLPNKTDGPTIVTLRSTNGMRLQLVFENNGEVRLFAPEMTAPEAKAQLPEGATEFVLAILPDRCLVGTGDEWLLQLHFEISGDWYPTLEPRSDWVGVQRLQYSSDPDSALRSTPQLPPGEQAAVECLIAANGFATSVPDGEQTNPFRIRAMKASKEFMELRGAELVAGCQKLSRLFLSGVKEEAIPHLASLTRLERLSIWTSTLPSGTLERFQLGQLETLDLWNTTLEQPDFSVLAKATNLRYVGIPNVAVTDDDLRDLAQVKSLENLYVNGRLVSVDGLQSLAGLPQLQELELSNVRLTEQLIASLAGLEQIGWLSLRYCDASDVDLEEFVRLQHLHTLLLDGCNISPDGLRRLGRLLPNCRISPPADLPGI